MNAMKKWCNPYGKGFGLLVIRLGLGVIFIWHGWDKLSHMEGYKMVFTNFFGLSNFWLWVVALTEFVGGIAILLGLWVGVAGALLGVNMVVAIFLVKWKLVMSSGFTAAEIDLMLMCAAFGIAMTGAGRYSIQKLLCKCGKCGTCSYGKCAGCGVSMNTDKKCGACGCGDKCGSKDACADGVCATCPCNKK